MFSLLVLGSKFVMVSSTYTTKDLVLNVGSDSNDLFSCFLDAYPFFSRLDTEHDEIAIREVICSYLDE